MTAATAATTPDEAAAWARLDAELAAWRDAGRVATLWWRDDDAGNATVPLLLLLQVSEGFAVPLTLAAVPAAVTADLAEAVAGTRLTTVVQHGYAHANHAPAGAKKAELGPERPAAVVVGELAAGWQALERHFRTRFFPAMVPPWNRMAPYLAPYLAEMRYRGVSQFGPRPRAAAAPGLIQANTHTDIVYWKDTRPRFAGAAKSLDGLTEHLAARRAGAVDALEPTGLLTHHLSHDPECWRFLMRLLARLKEEPAVAWLAADAVFAGAPAGHLRAVGPGRPGAP